MYIKASLLLTYIIVASCGPPSSYIARKAAYFSSLSTIMAKKLCAALLLFGYLIHYHTSLDNLLFRTTMSSGLVGRGSASSAVARDRTWTWGNGLSKRTFGLAGHLRLAWNCTNRLKTIAMCKWWLTFVFAVAPRWLRALC